MPYYTTVNAYGTSCTANSTQTFFPVSTLCILSAPPHTKAHLPVHLEGIHGTVWWHCMGHNPSHWWTCEMQLGACFLWRVVSLFPTLVTTGGCHVSSVYLQAAIRPHTEHGDKVFTTALICFLPETNKDVKCYSSSVRVDTQPMVLPLWQGISKHAVWWGTALSLWSKSHMPGLIYILQNVSHCWKVKLSSGQQSPVTAGRELDVPCYKGCGAMSSKCHRELNSCRQNRRLQNPVEPGSREEVSPHHLASKNPAQRVLLHV